MIGIMPAVDEFISDAKSRLTSEQQKDTNAVSSCEKSAKLIYYQTLLITYRLCSAKNY